MRAAAALVLSLLVALNPTAQACTTLLVTAKDGAVVSGRTMEFGFDVKSDVMIVPAGTPMTGYSAGCARHQHTTKYAMIGANALGMPVIVDGINEQGF